MLSVVLRLIWEFKDFLFLFLEVLTWISCKKCTTEISICPDEYRGGRQRRKHSQLQDQDDLCLVFKDFVQRDDVRVLDLLQDADLALDVLPRHPPSTRFTAPLLDEFGGVLHARAPVPTSSDHSKLTAGEVERRGRDCQSCIHCSFEALTFNSWKSGASRQI